MFLQSAYACSPVGPGRQASRPTCQPVKAINHLAEHKVTAGVAQTCTHWIPTVTRRQQLASIAAALVYLEVLPRPTTAAEESAPSSSALKAIDAIRRDFVERQYYVTGNLTPQLFAPDCVFKDPTVEVVGVEPYVRALQALFDPSTSRADLISIRATAPSTVVLRWRLEGSLKLAGLKIKPYTGTTVYTLSDDGKVIRHEETWDISTVDAFVSTFFPGFGAPPAPPVPPVLPTTV